MNVKNVKRVRFGSKRGRKAIAEIIAALLLILIAVAAGAVVYTYILNFVGNVAQNNGGNKSQISIDDFCVSASTKCTQVAGTGTSYYIVVRNIGTVSISINGTMTPALYFHDVTAGNDTAASCNSPPSTVPPGGTFRCFGLSNTIGARGGDTVSVKVVNTDGGTTTASSKALS